MAEGLDFAGALPDVSVGGLTNIFLWAGIIIFILVVLTIIAYFLIIWWRYKAKVEIWEKVGGIPKRVKTTRGRFVRYGDVGDRVFFIRKPKLIVPVPEFQAGDNTYLFYVRSDGELMNFQPEDFDEIQKKLGAKFLHKEMRYARVSLAEKFKERFDKQSWFEKYGAIAVNVIAVIILLVFVFLILDKVFSAASQLNRALELTAQLQQENARVISLLDQLVSNSGITPT